MPMSDQDIINQLSQEFKQRLNSELNLSSSNSSINQNFSGIQNLQGNMIHSYEYEEFKKQFMPKQASFYEKMCIFAYKLFPINVSENLHKRYQPFLKRCHLGINANHVISAAVVYSFFVFILIALFGAFYGLLYNDFNAISFFVLIGLLLSGFSFYILYTYPQYLALLWKIKASSSLVESLFYIVTFLRHTSNLERAVDFAAEHLPPPLSLDFKKILWDVENGTYSSIKESIYHFLEQWESDDPTYCQAMNLILSSLDEGNEQRRIELLDNSLDLMLNGSFERMLKYTHELQQPVTMIHMMGVVLPMMATVMLPLAISFAEGIKWYHIALLYDLLLPIFLVWKSNQILATRPSSIGFSTYEMNTNVPKKKYLFNAILILFFFLFIGFGPVTWMKLFFVSEVAGGYEDIVVYMVEGTNLKIQLLDYRLVGNPPVQEGPYSFVAAVVGLSVVFGIAYSMGYYFSKTSNFLMKIKEQTKKLEDEMLSVLLQLGNRLNEGIPAEIAFRKLYETLSDSMEMKKFVQIIIYNLENRGMGLEESIFDSQYGALVYYPSPLIASSMKIMIDAGRKGPRVAGTAMINLAEYLKKVKEVNRRVNDLLAESLSGMKAIINFLGPVLNGIIIGLSAMISTVIVNLQDFMKNLNDSSIGGAAGGLTDLLKEGMPSYHFHIINGIYIVFIVYILSELISVLEHGADDVIKNGYKGNNLIKMAIFYTSLGALLTFVFSFIAITVIAGGL